MKLLTLKIKNITSLPEATIDFTAEPLSSAPIFLISGDIGAGKSTILDCICLALYNSTPRMENWKSSGLDRNEDQISEKSTQNLLRRGAGYGGVSLSFLGDDETLYLAEWSVQRAYKRADGKLQAEKWTLEYDRDGRHHILNKKNELKKQIPEIIGLQFEQFCRTSMLAQGEFTRFLNSKDEEKAEILEKITGSGIYAETGRKIYRRISSLKDKYSSLKEKAGDIKLLSPEELASLNREYKELSAMSAAERRKEAAMIEKINWLKQREALRKGYDEASAHLRKLKERETSSESLKRDALMEQLVKSKEARNLDLQLKEIESEISNQRNALGLLRLEGRRMIVSTQKSLDEKDRLMAEQKSLEAIISENDSKKELYDNVSRFEELVTAIIRLQTEIPDLELSLKDKETSLYKKIEHEQKPALEKEADTKALLSRIVEDIKIKTQSLAEIDGEKPDLLLEHANARLILLNECRNVAESIKREESIIHNAQISAKEHEQKLKHDNELLKEYKAIFLKAEEMLRLSEEELDSMKRTTKEWTQELRSHLHIGDNCPVCGAIIDHLLPSEDELLEKLREKTRLRDDAKKNFNDINAKLTELRISIKMLASAFEEARKKSNDFSELNILKEKSHTLIARGGVMTEKEYEEGIGQAKVEKVRLQKLMQRRASIANEISDLTKKRNQTDRKIQNIRIELERINGASEKIRIAIASLKATVSEKNNQLEILRSDLSDLASSHDCKFDGQNPAAFLKTLNQEAQEFINNLKTHERLTHRIASMTPILNQASDFMLNFQDEISEAQHIEEDELISEEELLQRWISFNSEWVNLKTSISQASTKQKKVKEAFDEEIAGIGLTADEINVLLRLPPDTESKLAEDKRKETEELKAAEGALRNSGSLLQKHLDNSPRFTEGEDTETLTLEIEKTRNLMHLNSVRIGEIRAVIEADNAQKSAGKNLLNQIKLLEKEIDRWNRLSDLSDLQGKKFKMIAQSYVLGSLVETANLYLSKLSGRYRLSHGTGTFTLYVEDAWDGYVKRPASTISGGESFLVSLSLALALTDFSGSLHIDTLFIDEGFGSLSGDSLTRAVNVLRDLHDISGRKVGIISHIPALIEEIPVQIRLRRSPGSSATTLSIE